jgi:hypothetical protein
MNSTDFRAAQIQFSSILSFLEVKLAKKITQLVFVAENFLSLLRLGGKYNGF